MSGMRVGLAVDQLRRAVPGGIGRYATGLLGGLVELAAAEPARPRGMDVTLLASRVPGTGFIGRPEHDPLERFGMQVQRSPLPSRLLIKAWDLGVLHAPRRFDVVHSVSPAAPPVRQPRRARPRQSLLVMVHDLAWRSFPETATARGRRWHEAAVGRAVRRADVIVATTERLADELRASGARSVIVVQYGNDHLPTPDMSATADLLGHLGVSGPYFLTVGTREPRKNLGRLATAYARARQSLPEPWPLVVVGPRGWGEEQLPAAREQRRPGEPSGDGVIIAGEVTDEVLAGLLAGARTFAYVPLIEGFGLPPLEACSFGIPVVASRTVPSVEVPGGRPVAIRVDPLDVEEIEGALVTAALDESRRAQLSSAAIEFARRWTWRDVARRHVELWEDVV